MTYGGAQFSCPPWNQELKLGCSDVFAVSAVQLCSDCSPTPPPWISSWSWAAVSAVQCFSDCSPTPPPPQNQKWNLGCSECSSTLQWLQSNPPPQNQKFNFTVTAVQPPPQPPQSGVEVGAAVSAVQLCSDCSLTPPKSKVELWLQWVQFNFAVTAVQIPPPPPRIRSWSWAAVSAVQLFSDCSLTPPPQNQKWNLGCSECSSTLQWLQSDPPPKSGVEVGLQWVQFNFSVTAVQTPPPPHNQELKLGCSECSSTLQWLQSDPRTLQNCNFRILNI